GSQSEPAPPAGVRQSQLRGDPHGPARERALRARAGRLHRSRRPADGTVRDRRSRHDFPRRDRGSAARAPAQAAARPAGARVRAPRKLADHAHRRAPGGRDQRRTGRDGRREEIPIRPLLPAERVSDSPAAAARTAGGHSPPGPPFHAAVLPAHGPLGQVDRLVGDGRAHAVLVAGQHPRAAEPDRARGDPVARRQARRSAVGARGDRRPAKGVRRLSDARRGGPRADPGHAERHGLGPRGTARRRAAPGHQPQHPPVSDEEAGYRAPGAGGLTVRALAAALMLACAAVASAQEPDAVGIIVEPGLLTKAIHLSDRWVGDGREPGDGFYAALGNMITGAGWISAGPGYRRHVLGGRAVFDVSAALSSNVYKVAQARLEWSHLANDRLAVRAQAMYHDLRAVHYFGVRPDSARSDRVRYRFDDTDLLGYATVRARTWLSLNGRFGKVDRPGHRAPSFLHGDLAIAADWRP